MKAFLSGDEAVAEGVRLARPNVISAYPITPQTVVVERLSEMVASGQLDAEYMHVESEHSALSAAMGASATGARTFTATSSQGLLYMAEVLTYAAGGRFPIVMMNANRSTALPWNIYGDQRDSLSLLDHGWIQTYAEDNQEALDLVVMAYAIAENQSVSAPFVLNLDGFALTHTYETVDIPTQEEVDSFLPKFETKNKFNFENPVNIAFSAGPDSNALFKRAEHEDMTSAFEVICEVEKKFSKVFNREYLGSVGAYKCEDADYVVVTLGSISGLVRCVVDELRKEGGRVGLLKIRYMRPFPSHLVSSALKNCKSFAVLEKDISFGFEGTVFSNVKAALFDEGVLKPALDFIGGLGGDDITKEDIYSIFDMLQKRAIDKEMPVINWLGCASDKGTSR